MNIKIRNSSINNMLQLCKKLKNGTVTRGEVEMVLDHEDYNFEFDRYNGRISKAEFIEYFLNIPNIIENEIKNVGLKTHHKYYKALLDNIDFYLEKSKEIMSMKKEIFEEKVKIALKGLPEDIDLMELNFIFTIGIGQSFGYAHKNGMHFDLLQLVDKNLEQFYSTIAHEVHHVGLNKLDEELNFDSMNLEELFYICFSGEGLAVKYCNNAEGILSKSIYNTTKNIGLDTFTWEYLNMDFYNTMDKFKKTIDDIRNNRIKDRDDLNNLLIEYWMNPYTEGQEKGDVPNLKHFRLYSLGNEIWGIIHDCFGKEVVFDTLRNPSSFPEVFNKALDKIGHGEFKIKERIMD